MMKSIRLFLLIFGLSILGACSPNITAPAIAPFQTAIATSAAAPTNFAGAPLPRAAPEFDARQAFEVNKMLAVSIGSRAAGSESGARARDYIAQQFKEAGLTVEKQPFPFKAWEDRGTSVGVISPQQRKIEALPIQYSPPGSAQAEVAPVQGNGRFEDFANANVRGKIALVARGTIPFSDKAKNAAEAGAIAVLIYNNAPGGFTGTLRDPISIPALAISGTEGRSMLDELAKGAVIVSISSDTLVAEKTGYNVIGRLAGTLDDTYILGGHYDSVQAGPGANDNGSGTAILIELAHNLGKSRHKNTYAIIAFDAEELGLLGSRYYVENLPEADRTRLKGMLNFDMLGAGSGPLLLGGDGRLATLARDVAAQQGINARNFQLGGNAGSDHQPFQQVRVDTVFVTRDYDLLHTPQDTIDQVKEDWLGEAGRVAIRVVEELEEKTTQ